MNIVLDQLVELITVKLYAVGSGNLVTVITCCLRMATEQTSLQISKIRANL